MPDATSTAEVVRNRNATTPKDPDLGPAIAAMHQQYPRLASYPVTAAWGPPDPQRQLEYYPPWERDNPNPGQSTLQVYNRGLQGQSLIDALAGDMLHLIGATDPQTGQPVDPRWMAMKRQLLASMTPEQIAVNARAYQDAVAHGERRSFEDWLERSRADAFVRGGVVRQWPQEVYTPDQLRLIEGMRQYLTSRDNAHEDTTFADLADSAGGSLVTDDAR